MIYIQSQHPSRRYIYLSSYVQAILDHIYICIYTSILLSPASMCTVIPVLYQDCRCNGVTGISIIILRRESGSWRLVREMSFCSGYHPRQTSTSTVGICGLISNLHKNGRMTMQHGCRLYALPSSAWWSNQVDEHTITPRCSCSPIKLSPWHDYSTEHCRRSCLG